MQDYLTSAIRQFKYYKQLGEQTIEQLSEDELYWQYNADANSIAVIVKHLWGNMLSRWTDFLTTDGEKEWRKRDAEFEPDPVSAKTVSEHWEEGWKCLFAAVEGLQPDDLTKIVYIRNQGHTVLEAINRQIAHYCYHVGQIVYIGKMIRGKDWKSLSIPKNASGAYNKQIFDVPKTKEHFTDKLLKKKD